MCNYAHSYHGIQLSHKYKLIKLKSKKMPIVYLSMDELKLINSIDEDLLNDRLTNVRDWLLISCFTGQRISDFMNFSIDNIRHQDEFSVMDILQEKGKKSVTIPVLNEVVKIMKRYDGGFPRQLSDQKYNDYLKEVCKIAKLEQKVKGKKQINISKDPTERKVRRVEGMYPKYELVTSHIGRRSFATNHYGKIPTSYLIYVTGHSSEEMFLNYIGKSNKDMALELTKYF